MKSQEELAMLVELTKRHYALMTTRDVLISVYTNASGFLWSAMMVRSGTELGYSDHNGDNVWSGTFSTYNKALADAVDLIESCSLKKFRHVTSSDTFHWGNYVDFLYARRNRLKKTRV